MYPRGGWTVCRHRHFPPDYFIMKKNIYLCLSLAFLLLSCASVKDVPYFQNSAEFDGSQGATLYDMTIKPKDRLNIIVYSATDNMAVLPFNIEEPLPIEAPDSRTGQQRIGIRYGQLHNYLVESDGTIDFPIVGKLHLAGLTIEQANDTIKSKILPYLNKEADCIVNTLLENYEVTVMGEVKYPNTFTITRNKCTVLEALALAGDMTVYGKRDNVKLLREMDNGEYEIHELDLRDANLLNSPYYYMQQRDILYVEPNEAMTQNSKIGTTRQLWVRGIQITLSLGTLLYRVLR